MGSVWVREAPVRAGWHAGTYYRFSLRTGMPPSFRPRSSIENGFGPFGRGGRAALSQCRTPPLAKSHSTHAGPECPSPPRCSGGSIAGADCLQSVSGNSRVLDTLGLKSQVVAYDQSSHLLRAVEQLESRARQPLPVHPSLQVGAARGFTITSRSIPGACCTFAHSPAIPSHPPPRRSQLDSCR